MYAPAGIYSNALGGEREGQEEWGKKLDRWG